MWHYVRACVGGRRGVNSSSCLQVESEAGPWWCPDEGEATQALPEEGAGVLGWNKPKGPGVQRNRMPLIKHRGVVPRGRFRSEEYVAITLLRFINTSWVKRSLSVQLI